MEMGIRYILDLRKVRFVRVRNRTIGNLITVIMNYVQPGILVWTHEFSSYKSLQEQGLIHETVNHSEQYVDHDTQAHAQEIERSWVDCEAGTKRSRGNKKLLHEI